MCLKVSLLHPWHLVNLIVDLLFAIRQLLSLIIAVLSDHLYPKCQLLMMKMMMIGKLIGAGNTAAGELRFDCLFMR